MEIEIGNYVFPAGFLWGAGTSSHQVEGGNTNDWSEWEKVNAESRVRRLGDVIVYEIKAPGIMNKEDVVVTELETGIEIRAYAKDRCYVKVIPLKVEILGMRIGREKISVELKG